jgi:riboflavin kinase/FMN adenylyltransferase
MILLRDSSPVLPQFKGAVMALGNFDGLQAVERARKESRPAAVMTFEPHPRRVFSPHLPPLRILPLKEKLHLLEKMGLDFLRVVRFTRDFAQTTAEYFVSHILHEQLAVSEVITGEDFVFGHNREGTAGHLQSIAHRLGFSAATCPAIEVEGNRCSSTRIREALAEGNVSLAAAFRQGM